MGTKEVLEGDFVLKGLQSLGYYKYVILVVDVQGTVFHL